MTTPEQEAQQAVFETATVHLMMQGKKSQAFMGKVDDLTCAYRSPEGLKCAIGALFPDEEYRPFFEGDTVKGLVERADGPPTLKRLAEATGRPFLSCLQEVHDDHAVTEWPKALRWVASLYGLDTSKVPA